MLISISLHLVEFNFILRATEKVWTSDAAVFKRLVKFQGITRTADVSSMNLILGASRTAAYLLLLGGSVCLYFCLG